MAMLEKVIPEDLDALAQRIRQGILGNSVSATLEEDARYQAGDARCAVLVFERYSYIGGNRVSMNVTLFQAGDGPVQLCAVTSGGSRAVFFKINTVGEENFLLDLEEIL